MVSWFDLVVLVAALLLLLPFLVLTVEVLAALIPRGGRKGTLFRPSGIRCAILIPAHDEETGLGTTLAALADQLGPKDRLLVVADNCSDRTAEVARQGGAEVVERVDPDRRGKGFALDRGVRALEADPPDVVVIIDADCLARPGAIENLAAAAWQTGRPVQAVYLLRCPPEAGVLGQLSAFAFLFKNQVRPLGLTRLGLPCLLTGAGMAFPWAVLQQAQLASDNIVEDMQLGLDLACRGRPPTFCAQAQVDSILPVGREAASRQRTRWEHGHLRTLLTQTPRLVLAGLARGRLDLLGLALELSVPPLSLLGLLYGAAWLLWWAWPSLLAGMVLAGGGLAAGGAIFAAWARFGRNCLPFPSLLAAPFYVLGKVPRFLAFLIRPQRLWIRTARDQPPPSSNP